jgi:hypothetical protein
MPGPGFARPDLCSIRAATEQEELAEAIRSGFSADGYPPGGDDPPVSLTSGIPSLARWLLGLGIAATLTANMAQGWSHGPVGAVVAAWPAVSLVGSCELLVWLIRMSGTAEHRPPAGHRCDAAACRVAASFAATAATAAGFPRRGERGTPDQERQPAAQAAGPGISASGQRDQAVPEAGTVNDAAVAAYRLSAQAGNPLSERKLAQMSPVDYERASQAGEAA